MNTPLTMKKNWLVYPTLLSLCGCHVNGDVMLGRHSDYQDGSYASGLPAGGCYLYRVVTSSNFPSSTSTCTVPQNNLLSISVDPDATVHVWVNKLTDGKFPFVASLAYSDSQSDYTAGHEIFLTCATPSGTQDPNAVQQEISCTPTQGLPLTSARTSGTDVEFYFHSLTLQDPTCGASMTYSLGTTWGSCTGGVTTGAGTQIENVLFPDLYWKS